MEVLPTDGLIQTAVPTGGGVFARVVAGNVAKLPLGALLQATVTSVKPREANLTVNGQELTVQAPPGLRPGAVLLVRVPATANAANPTLELGAPAPAPTPQNAHPAAMPPQPGRTALVDVLTKLPDGRFQVVIDGREQIATSAEPLVAGQRYVVQAQPTPAGVILKPQAGGPKLTTEVATAILRTPAPEFAAAIRPLQAELANLAAPSAGGGQPPMPAVVREAATAVRDLLRTFVPDEPRPLKPAELQQLVENGGLHYEAKLARLAAPRELPSAVPTEGQQAPPATADAREGAPPARELAPDLKGDLLRLLQTVRDLGGSPHAEAAPAAQAALSGIESQQAGNALAQSANAPYVVQVPFPDGGQWRTLHLSLEPQNRPDRPDAERAGRFRLFMHVPLTDLGETWIDAGLSGDQFRATIYLDRAPVRDRVRAALPELGAELRAEGFGEVLLDVRSAGELPERRRREASAMQAGRPGSVSVLDVRA